MRTRQKPVTREALLISSVLLFSLVWRKSKKMWIYHIECTCCKQQHIVHAFIWSLDSVNSYLGKVLITCEERCFSLNGMNPVLHLWIVFNNLERRMRNGIAVFHTLEKMSFHNVISVHCLRSEVITIPLLPKQRPRQKWLYFLKHKWRFKIAIVRKP